jgi:uncharacterized SAM-binding protein YcdF (DUF218 family)
MGKIVIDQIIALIEPTGLAWAWLLVLTLLCALRRRWRTAAAVAVPMLILWVFGSTDVPGVLLRDLERPWAYLDLKTVPSCDAIVLLGGGAEPARFEAGGLHLSPAGDRVMMALELSKLGKAPAIVIGGNAADFPEGPIAESETVRDWMLSRQFTQGEVIALPPCGDTHDEAVAVARLVGERGWHQVLLVTSANHMRRAAATFRTAGVNVAPVACNFLTELSHAPSPGIALVPRAGGLGKTGIWLHEQIGWLEYRRRGWIDARQSQ